MARPPVGRASVWEDLEQVLTSRRSGLVLIHGAPGVGRTHLMKAFGTAAGDDHGFTVMGCQEPIPIEPTTQLSDIHRVLISQPLAAPDAPPAGLSDVAGLWNRTVRAVKGAWRFDSLLIEALRDAAPVLVAVDGYAPTRPVETWVVERLVPALGEQDEPVVLVVVDRTEAVSSLQSAAILSVQLGSLDVDEVAGHLRESTTAVRPPLSDDEVSAYAEAASKDPALVWALDRVFATVAATGA